jgi:hypothetical protein
MFLGFDIIQDRRWPQSGERGCFCSNGECGECGECGAVSAMGAISAQPTKTVRVPACSVDMESVISGSPGSYVTRRVVKIWVSRESNSQATQHRTEGNHIGCLRYSVSRRGAVVHVVRGHWYNVDSHMSAVRRQLCSGEDNESPQALLVCCVMRAWWMVGGCVRKGVNQAPSFLAL